MKKKFGYEQRKLEISKEMWRRGALKKGLRKLYREEGIATESGMESGMETAMESGMETAMETATNAATNAATESATKESKTKSPIIKSTNETTINTTQTALTKSTNRKLRRTKKGQPLMRSVLKGLLAQIKPT